MKSFKLEKSGSHKKEASSIGGILIILGLIGAYLVHSYSFALVGIGLILVLASAFATEETKS